MKAIVAILCVTLFLPNKGYSGSAFPVGVVGVSPTTSSTLTQPKQHFALEKPQSMQNSAALGSTTMGRIASWSVLDRFALRRLEERAKAPLSASSLCREFMKSDSTFAE